MEYVNQVMKIMVISNNGSGMPASTAQLEAVLKRQNNFDAQFAAANRQMNIHVCYYLCVKARENKNFNLIQLNDTTNKNNLAARLMIENVS